MMAGCRNVFPALRDLTELPAHWRVVPVVGKRPPLSGWPDRAVPIRDRATLAAWLARWPGAALGLVCGPESGVLALDLDAPGQGHAADGLGAFEALEDELGTLPPTPCARTPSGGRHLLFAWPEGHGPIANRPLRPGVDIRASRGMIVLPTPGRTEGRRWVRRPDPASPLPSLPAPWLARILPPPRVPAPRSVRLGGGMPGRRYVEAALRSSVERVRTAPPGTRNDTLFREAACLTRFDDLADGEILEALTEAARAAGLPTREITATLRSALRRRR